MKEIDIITCKVVQVLDYGDVLIRYLIPPEYYSNRNVTGEDRMGKILWQVEDRLAPHDCTTFTNITPFDTCKIKAYSWLGVYCYIYIADGQIETIPNQRPW